MSKQSIADLSCLSGKSASTVSKVLRNCPGVDYETREAVRAALGEGSPEDLIRKRNRSRICVILPDNPKFFWGRAQAALTGHEVTLKIYSAIQADREDREVLHCVSEALAEDAAAIILAACPHEVLSGVLATAAGERLVLQLTEYTPVPNSFFVGSDYRRDGRALAEAVRSEGDARPVVGVLRGEATVSLKERIEGFLEGLKGRAEFVEIESPEPSSLYASHLARAIAQTGRRLDYLFCPMGATASVCDALYKLRDRMRTEYIGFEMPPAAEKHLREGRIAALAVQDPEKQMMEAMRLAERYVQTGTFPDGKFTYLPSKYHAQHKTEE